MALGQTQCSSHSMRRGRPFRKTTTALFGAVCLVGLCFASPLFKQQQQLPFDVVGPDYQQEAASISEATHFVAQFTSASTSEVSLYRLCLASEHSFHWTTALLPSLESLSIDRPDLPSDIWRYPRELPSTYQNNREDIQSCADFTFPSSQQAQKTMVEQVLGALPNHVEAHWLLLADQKELQRRISRQKNQEHYDLRLESMGSSSRRGGRDPKGTRVVDDHFHNGYHTLDNISAFLSYQVSQHPQVIELLDIGITYEKRVIQAVRVGRKLDKHGQTKKEIVITAGSHGREWVTTSTALYLLSALLESSSSSLLDTFSVLIVPTLNPDGYVYTWSSDRFFRKNRQLVSENRDWLGRKCYGVDLSRSFPTNFRPASPGSCGPTYAGTGPLQAAESRSLASYMLNETNEVIAYIDLHSYGQLLLYPWMSCHPTHGRADMPDEEDLAELALGAAREGRFAHNKAYRAGRGCSTMYNQDGTSVDWAHEEARIKWSFEVELRDEGSYGFTLPPEMIRPTGEEIWRMVEYLMRFVKEKEKL